MNIVDRIIRFMYRPRSFTLKLWPYRSRRITNSPSDGVSPSVANYGHGNQQCSYGLMLTVRWDIVPYDFRWSPSSAQNKALRRHSGDEES